MTSQLQQQEQQHQSEIQSLNERFESTNTSKDVEVDSKTKEEI